MLILCTCELNRNWSLFKKKNKIIENKSLICDKGVTTQNLAFLSYWYRKKHLQIHY